MLIGADSFIAGCFIRDQGRRYDIKGASLVSSSLEDEVVLDDLFKLSGEHFSGMDAVINFAAIVHRPDMDERKIYDRINHRLPVHLARSAAGAGVQHFVQMSTIAVHGNAVRISTSTPYNPVSPYGQSKLDADRGLIDMQRNGFTVSIIRPSMVYGGGPAPGNMMKLIRLCDSAVPLPFGKIDNGRQFAYAGLVTDVLGRIISKQAGGIFLAADRQPVSTFELVRIIRSRLGRRNNQFRLPSPFRRIIKTLKPSLYRKVFESLIIDVEDTFRELGIPESGSHIEDGISEMVEWYRRR